MKLFLCISLIFSGWWYNHYFGWNAEPKNDAEIICDMLYGLMAVIAMGFSAVLDAINKGRKP